MSSYHMRNSGEWRPPNDSPIAGPTAGNNIIIKP